MKVKPLPGKFLNKILDIYYRVRTGNPAYLRRYKKVLATRGRKLLGEINYDILYVVPPEDDGQWILHAICKELDKYFDGKSTFSTTNNILPESRVYFYSHYSLFRTALLKQPELIKSTNLVYYTHPRQFGYSESEVLFMLGLADKVICMNSGHAGLLRDLGLQNVEVVLAGADKHFFSCHRRTRRAVGFCSGYQPRKNGELMLSVISRMPDVTFRLCGRNWKKWHRWTELVALKNFEYIETSYDNYPDFYNSIDVLVSVSSVEGGPIPILEGMMSNVVPVASAIGHCPDVIEHGINGYLFDVSSDANLICQLIEQAFELDTDIRSTVEHLTWERFSRKVQGYAALA